MRTSPSRGKSYQIPESWEKSLGRNISEALKQEPFDAWADKCPKFITRNIENPDPFKNNVIRVLSFPEVSPSGKTDLIKDFGYSHNLVTDDGDIFYAKQGAGETPSVNENFATSDANFEMGSGDTTEAKGDTYTQFNATAGNPIASSLKIYTASYPKTNDTGDADNTGDAVDAVSYAVNYLAGDWNDTDVEQGVIIDDPTPMDADQILTNFSFTSFAKTASDTLKVFVNHTMNGV